MYDLKNWAFLSVVFVYTLHFKCWLYIAIEIIKGHWLIKVKMGIALKTIK